MNTISEPDSLVIKETEDALREIMEDLAKDTDDIAVIARRLEDAQCAGFTISGTRCPLALYGTRNLISRGVLPSNLNVIMEYTGHYRVDAYLSGSDEFVSLSSRIHLPVILGHFARAFDDREFPVLLAESPSMNDE